MHGEVFDRLNRQNTLDEIVRVSDVTSAEKKAQLEEESYLVGFTAEEWAKRFPKIPADKVVCPKSVLYPASLVYYDPAKAVCFQLHPFSGMPLQSEPMTDEEVEQRILEQIAEMEKKHRERKYTSLLMPTSSEGGGNVTMRLFCDILREDAPGEDIFAAFLDFYSGSDCGTGILFREAGALDKLLACRSEAQKASVLEALKDYPAIFTVYRGEGNKSTDYHTALSWTTDVNKAYFFASWRSDGAPSRILTAKVAKSDVLAYLTGRGESEVLLLPSSLRDVNVTPCVSMDAFRAALGETDATDMLTAVRTTYESLEDGEDAKPENHTMTHTGRVVLYASYLYHALVAEAAAEERKGMVARAHRQLMQAILWHDAGRASDGVEDGHGAAGYRRFLAAGNKPDKVVEFLTTYHCLPDEEAKAYFRKKFSAVKGSNMVWDMYQIMKDADALDRWRFGTLCENFVDVNYLRFPLSRALMPVAAALQYMRLW